MNESWFKSKPLRFMAVYWGVIIMLTYTAEWADRHSAGLGIALKLVLLTAAAWLVLRVIALRRNRQRW